MVNKSENVRSRKVSVENTDVKGTPEWLTEELFREFLEKDFPNFEKISKFIVKPGVAAGENYMTLMLRVTIAVDMPDSSTKTTSYMVKTNPTVEKLQILIKEWQIFLKEHCTYTKLIPKFEEYYRLAGMKVQLAPHILVPHKVQVNDDILILEDLRLQGFKNANRQLGLDIIHTKAVLRKLAQFHAASAHYAQTDGPFPPMYDRCCSGEKGLFEDHRLNVSKIFREHLHLFGDAQHLEQKLKTFAETQCDPFELESQKNPDEFYVLNHGDLWINNIMFQYNDDGSVNETYFIDFQLGRYGSPAQDLLYFLISSPNLKIKLKHFDYFISYYHGQLIEHLELIKYEGKMPKLRDIHMALFKHDYWVYTTICDLMPLVFCESRDDASADTLLSEDGDELRRSMYRNRNYVDSTAMLLPWLNRRGCFDL